MFVVEKLFDLLERVPVHGLHILGGEAHGYDAVADVREVQVELFVDEPTFLLAHQLLNSRRHF